VCTARHLFQHTLKVLTPTPFCHHKYTEKNTKTNPPLLPLLTSSTHPVSFSTERITDRILSTSAIQFFFPALHTHWSHSPLSTRERRSRLYSVSICMSHTHSHCHTHIIPITCYPCHSTIMGDADPFYLRYIYSSPPPLISP